MSIQMPRRHTFSQSLWMSDALKLGPAAHRAGSLYILPALDQGANVALAFARPLQEVMRDAGPTPDDQPQILAILCENIHRHIQTSIAQGCICS